MSSTVLDLGSGGIALAAFAVLFIGLAKAGFGGGLGMLTTPLCVIAFGPRDAIGILLPLLCLGDWFSLYHYWRRWEQRNLALLLPGVLVGVCIGVWMVGRFSARQLNLAIGLLALAFVAFQCGKDRWLRSTRVFAPGAGVGSLFGFGAGLTSTFSHGAGPVVAMFLIPQRLPKEVYVGTSVLVFTCINLLKLPFFVATGLVNGNTVQSSLGLAPLVPLGVWIGVWLNRRVSERLFLRVVYTVTALTGLHLVLDW